MRPGALRLDSFSPRAADTARQLAQVQCDEAFRRGHEKGLAEGRQSSLDELTGALTGLGRQMRADREREQALRRDLLDALVPVLHAVVDMLGPLSARERLRLALAAELARIAEHAPGQALTLRCPTGLRPDVAECLGRAELPQGLGQVRIEDLPAEGDLVELATGQGTIIFDPSLVTTGLKAIMDDIRTED